ncbi:hypothetical protein B0H19DRAFT_1071302 [Mycena capillaripes]|nr:hypothetical protein B0H19DRAFT_1071302 [Mycena capillaripes]
MREGNGTDNWDGTDPSVYLPWSQWLLDWISHNEKATEDSDLKSWGVAGPSEGAGVEVLNLVSGLNLYVEGLGPFERLQTALAVEYILSTGSNYNPEWRSSVVELQ